MRSRKNLKDPNSISEELFDLSSMPSPGGAGIPRPSNSQALESQPYSHSRAPGVLEPLPDCYYVQGAGYFAGSRGYIRREIEYQVA